MIRSARSGSELRFLPADVNRRIGRAMYDYQMLTQGDRVLLGVSGGIDSLVLAWLLTTWQRKAPISYTVLPVHIAMQPEEDKESDPAEKVAALMRRFGLELLVEPAAWRPELDAPVREGGNGRDVCFRCARARRKQFFDLARRLGATKLALGHHRDDLVETFFLNLTCSGNLSTMLPRQDLFHGRLAIIRPLSYICREEIDELANRLGLEPVAGTCPLAGCTKRDQIRDLLHTIYDRLPGSRHHMFAALANVRQDYLLRPASGRGSASGSRKSRNETAQADSSHADRT